MTYDTQGNVASRTDALLSTMTYTYDSMNRLIQLKAPNAEQTSFTYELNGNMTVLTNR